MIKENRKPKLVLDEHAASKSAATAAEMKHIMKLVAAALNMGVDNYYTGRTREQADLRCIACLLIKMQYPRTPIMAAVNATKLARNTITYHIIRARNYVETNERTFVKKLKTVIKTLSNDQNQNTAQDNYGPKRPGSTDVCLPNRRRANAIINER